MAEQIQSAVDLLLGNPPSDLQKYVLLSLGLVVVYLLFERMNRTLDVRRADPAKALFLVVLGGVVIVMSLVLARQEVIPRIGGRYEVAALILCPVVASLVITVPLMCLMQKATYLSSAISWSVSVIVTAFLIILIRVGIDSLTTGKASLKSTKERTHEIENFLKDQ